MSQNVFEAVTFGERGNGFDQPSVELFNRCTVLNDALSPFLNISLDGI